MNPLTQIILYTYAAAILILAQAGQAADRVEYTITELKTPDGMTMIPYQINDRGDVIGYSTDSNSFSHPFLYRNGVMQPLGHNEKMGYPYALNNAGDILCWFLTNQTFYSVLITSNGSEIRLSQALGGGFSPMAMNDVGDILGYDDSNTILVYNYISGTVHELKSPDMNVASDINNSGDVVGYGEVFGTIFHGTNYVHFGAPGRREYVGPAAINNLGQIAGFIHGKDDVFEGRPFIYDDGHMTKLPCLPGDYTAGAVDINDAGEVIGVSWRSAQALFPRAFVYKNHKLEDLNALMPPHPGWTLNEPLCINSHGQIVGWGSRVVLDQPMIDYYGVILTPIPGK